ncbi:MAG: glutamine synthetase adenylyltransferase [Fuerstiella sp.]
MMFPPFHKLVPAEFDQNCRSLSDAGFSDTESAIQNLMRLREASVQYDADQKQPRPQSTPAWFQTLKRILLEAPSPSVVLDAVDRFVAKCSSATSAFALFEEAPRSLEVLARISCGSPFLTQALLNQPDVLRELTFERRTAEMKSREDFVNEATTAIQDLTTSETKLSTLRCFQRREILRIGMCDAFGLLDLKFVTLQISLLADAMVQLCLRIACEDSGITEAPFAVLALGKHGGEELNYSSDIDLILVAKNSDAPKLKQVARGLIDGLSENMATGFLYRVDMRLRPWGDAGPLATTPDSYEHYLKTDAKLWEKQALLKARIVAGDMPTGNDLLQRLPPLLFAVRKEDVIANVVNMKGQIEDRLRRRGKLASEVKLGSGSIRDIEFLVQALQLIHGSEEPRVASANTLDALVRLADFGLIDVSIYRQLREGYIFLRTIEHALQLLHNQQTHELPDNSEQREWLARRMDYPSEADLLNRFDAHRRAVRKIFDAQFRGDSNVELPETNPQSQSQLEVATIEHSELATYFRDHFAEHEALRNSMFSELQRGARCCVHGQSLGSNSRLQLLTIAVPETPGLTSMICGVFFANFLDIREGDCNNGAGPNRFGGEIAPDRFLGIFLCEDTSSNESTSARTTAAVIQSELERLLNMQQTDKSSDVRATVLDMFCRRVANLKAAPSPLADLSIEVTQREDDGATVLRISADDSFGFFFELANALSICGFRILRAQLGQTNGRIQDILHVAESDGGVVSSKERIEELRTAVVLIKQFTNWLPSNNDPHQALLRFRDLLHTLLRKSQWESNVANLKQPEVLRAVAQVLGISRHLWEDFLQVRSEKLLPLLTDPEQLQNRITRSEFHSELSEILKAAKTPAKQVKALNTFKDLQLFRTDLRHVLGHCGPFGTFSDEITELAEVIVDAACQIAFAELRDAHGVPKLADGTTCPFTIVALGKFGGVEMGFASDIEMFLVFQEECRTDSNSAMTASHFFERMIARVTDIIKCRHKGIFAIDLRMRPYGQAGSPAVSLNSLKSYFAPDGDAWPYERQSLVKLRCVSGDAAFSREVDQACKDIVYTDSGFDFDAMRGMREKQIRQLVHGGTINAKLSDGALVDCEYAAQALQLTFGKRLSSLQTTNTLKAIAAARKEGLLSQQECDSATTAYVFLRELIDCLRMARGNAKDLTIPPQDSADYAQLVKRMEAVHNSPLPLDQLESQLAAVKSFSALVEQICKQSGSRF